MTFPQTNQNGFSLSRFGLVHFCTVAERKRYTRRRRRVWSPGCHQSAIFRGSILAKLTPRQNQPPTKKKPPPVLKLIRLWTDYRRRRRRVFITIVGFSDGLQSHWWLKNPRPLVCSAHKAPKMDTRKQTKPSRTTGSNLIRQINCAYQPENGSEIER